MKFREGDRVHVTQLDNMKVDFYATLNRNPANPACFKLEDCSNSTHEEKTVWQIVTNNSCDYYTLAEDEEYTGGNKMPTIKKKVEMNLPQLIEYVWKNDVKAMSYRRLNRRTFEYVWVNEDSNIEFNEDMLFRKDDILEIEVEEEITEDTKLDLVERYSSRYEYFKPRYMHHQNKSINSVLENNMPHINTTHFYTEVNDKLILIWRDGKLVE